MFCCAAAGGLQSRPRAARNANRRYACMACLLMGRGRDRRLVSLLTGWVILVKIAQQRQTMKTVLITGASGDVGSHLRRELAAKYKLRLSDLRPLEKKAKGESFMKADISRMADAVRITKGVDAIVHLGGYSVEGPWEDILQTNIDGCYNVF